jgi:protein-tyrosine kinase
VSFIDKALERAKTLHKKPEKAGSPAGTPQSSSPTSPGVVRTAEHQGFPGEIVYTTTRVVQVDPENLRRQHLIGGGGESEAAVAEGYKMLRTHILQQTAEEGRNTLMVTGPLQGEGKTLTAINLAIVLSHELNHTVLLVDADLRAPSITHYLGLGDEPGIVDFLTAGVPVSELLIHPQGLGKLVILPAGRQVAHAVELLNSPAMRDLVQELKHFYTNRYVIFDLPPLLIYADALAFAPLVDGILVVVEAEKTSRENIQRCQEMLKKFNLLGLVLNKADADVNRRRPLNYYYPPKPGADARKRFRLPRVFK